MAYSLQTLFTDLTGILHGQTLNQIFNQYGIVNRAARDVIADLDPMETKRIAPISGTVFNGVWDYQVPTDLKGNKVIDLYPQVNRYPSDVWLQAYNQDFDRTKGTPWSGDMFTVLFNSGLKTIRINAPFLLPPIEMDSCTNASTWAATGGATTPTVDNVNYVSNSGSLLFDLSAGSPTGTLTDTLTQPLNLSAHLNQSTLFINTYLPTPSAVTSVNLKWGTDNADYYSVTTSVTQQNTIFTTGWNLLAFPWLGATVVGSPDPSNINYIAVTWNYNSTLQTSVRLDNINSNLGSILQMEYYSKYLFSNGSGTWQETCSAVTDTVNLDTDSYNLLFNLVAAYACQQQQGLDATFFDGQFFLDKYASLLAVYKAKYKSEIQLPQSSFYKVNKPLPSAWRWNN